MADAYSCALSNGHSDAPPAGDQGVGIEGSDLQEESANDDVPLAGNWEVVVVDFFGKKHNILTFTQLLTKLQLEVSRQTFQHVAVMSYANVTLVSNGYLGCAPQEPMVAISLQVLDAYRQLHRACPQLSTQAFMKGLCCLHKVG